MIDDYGVTKLIEYDNNDIFGDWSSPNKASSTFEIAVTITPVYPPINPGIKRDNDQESPSLPKWAKKAYSTDNIISDMKGIVKTRR